MKAFIVANYASGVGKCALFMPTVERVLQKENIEYSVFRTVDKETDIRTVRENINNYDVLICLGGDGTVNEVINAALAESSKTPIVTYHAVRPTISRQITRYRQIPVRR